MIKATSVTRCLIIKNQLSIRVTEINYKKPETYYFAFANSCALQEIDFGIILQIILAIEFQYLLATLIYSVRILLRISYLLISSIHFYNRQKKEAIVDDALTI